MLSEDEARGMVAGELASDFRAHNAEELIQRIRAFVMERLPELREFDQAPRDLV